MMNNEIVPGFDDDKDDSLKVQLEKAASITGGLIISLIGYIDTYNSNFFQKRVSKVVDAGFIRLIFECGGLNYVSSTGIGSFTSFLKTVKPQGGDVVLLNVQPKVYEVFQLLGFSQFFNLKSSREEALAFFQAGGGIAQTSGAPVFPKVFACPVCEKNLKAARLGRFRCSECKTILAIDAAGTVTLG
jgi:anti-anti-sigma factor